jgi:hypothetical protein
MTLVKKWILELESAERARLAGNEGRARVCARRAAGMAAQIFLTQHRVQTGVENFYNILLNLSQFPSLSPDLKTAVAHLTLRVDETFSLPPDVDLIADARYLCETLERML